MSAEPDIDMSATPVSALVDDVAVDPGTAPVAGPDLTEHVEPEAELPPLFPEPSPVPTVEIIADPAAVEDAGTEAATTDLFPPSDSFPSSELFPPSADPPTPAGGGQAVSVDPATLAASIAAAVAASVSTSITAALGPVLAAARPASDAVPDVVPDAVLAPSAPSPMPAVGGASDDASHGSQAADRRSHKARILSPYLGYLGYFVGAGLISGGVVHYPLDHDRYALITAAGVALFLAATMLNEFVLATAKPSASAAVRVIASSLMLSIGIGMLSGGIQHFQDFPDRATVLIPVGLVLSFAAYAIRHATGVRGAAVGMAGAAVVLVAVTAFFTLDRFVATPSVDVTGTHTHTPGEEEASEDEEKLSGDEDAEDEEEATGDEDDAAEDHTGGDDAEAEEPEHH